MHYQFHRQKQKGLLHLHSAKLFFKRTYPVDTPEIEITFDSILCLSFLLPACSGTMLIFDSLVFSLVSKKETTISPHPLASLYHSTWSFCAEGADGMGCPKLLMFRSPRQNLIWDRVFFNIYTYIYMAMGNYPTTHQKSELENCAIW